MLLEACIYSVEKPEMRTAVLQRVLTFLVSENHTKVEKKNTEEVEESKNRKYRIHQTIA